MSKRDKSPERSHCEQCKCLCERLKPKEIPATTDWGYVIADEASKKQLCCKCMLVFHNIIHQKSKLSKLCQTCKSTVRPCSVCGDVRCEELEKFDIDSEARGDEEGYYCCNHISWSRTFNVKRFQVIECDRCKHIMECNEVQDCPLEATEDEECKTCHSKGFAVLKCSRCKQDCCTRCHTHRDEDSTCICAPCSELRYMYVFQTDVNLMYAEKHIVNPFTAHGHTIKWQRQDEGYYVCSTNLDEKTMISVVDEQRKYLKKQALDASAWALLKVLN